MDAAGNNRYELLFMDDDGEIPSAKEQVIKKKQQPPTGAAAPKKPAPSKKSTAEKENKSATLNKNDSSSKKAPTPAGAGSGEGGQAPKARQVAVNAAGGNRPRYNNDNNRSVTFRSQNNEVREQREQREQREPREQRNNRRNFRENANGAETGNEQRPPRQFNRDRENRGPPRKREFDRQSGSDKTGVKSVDKRDGAGAHNWGSVKQEIEDINKANTGDAEAALTDKEESANDQSTEQVPANEEEEEAKEMTLDEYKALKQQRAKPQFNLRKAGEGEDTSQWKKMTVLNKKKEGDSEEELEYDPSLYPQRVGRMQRIVDIPFKFNDERRGGFGGRIRGRGPRPGGNEYRGRDGAGIGGGAGAGTGTGTGTGAGSGAGRFEEGGRRPPRNFGERQSRNAANHVPKVDDERQFPTLG